MFTVYDWIPLKEHTSSNSTLSNSSPCSPHYASRSPLAPTVSTPSSCDGSVTSKSFSS